MKVLCKFLSALQLKVVEEYWCSCEGWTKRLLQKLSRRRKLQEEKQVGKGGVKDERKEMDRYEEN